MQYLCMQLQIKVAAMGSTHAIFCIVLLAIAWTMNQVHGSELAGSSCAIGKADCAESTHGIWTTHVKLIVVWSCCRVML